MKFAKAFLVLLIGIPFFVMASEPIRIASKTFPESKILAEVAAQLLEQKGFEVERRFGLGGTLICYQALVNNEIDLYVEYTGTLEQSILKLTTRASIEELNELIAVKSITMLKPFGFNNTYAIVVKRETAEQLTLRTVGDLVSANDLTMAFSHEFLDREDGWPGQSGGTASGAERVRG